MIDLDDIQSLVIGLQRVSAMELRFLHFATPEIMQDFLERAAGLVTTADAPVSPGLPSDRLNVGISGAGFRLAAITARAYDALPSAFVAGMRAAAFRLGDEDASSPEHWDLPFRDAQPDVHAVVIGFDGADTGVVVDPDAGQPGPRTLATWIAERRDGDREAFGFRDGISDPVIDGSGKVVTPGNGVWDAARNRWRAVRAGEAVLGYVDESGMIAGHPDAAQIERNGSYLVVRKLEQDVERFWSECREWSKALGGALGADDLAARMVGRHRDGTVLGGSVEEPLNDFLYADGGKPGIHVTPAAHIRRSNPRDGIASAGEIVPRHQLFRRGLPYHEEHADGSPPTDGLLFLACCADVRRQFEFVQSHWLQDGLRFGLGHERDPLVGDRSLEPGNLPAEQHDVSVRGVDGSRINRELPSFVTTRGGEYFLLPSRRALRYLANQIHNAIEGIS